MIKFQTNESNVAASDLINSIERNLESPSNDNFIIASIALLRYNRAVKRQAPDATFKVVVEQAITELENQFIFIKA